VAVTADPNGPEGKADGSQSEGRFPRATLVWSVVTLVALTAWFFFAWLVLDRLMLDAAGEAIGSGLLLLVVISVIAVLTHGRGAD
jgi:hypothetical protein